MAKKVSGCNCFVILVTVINNWLLYQIRTISTERSVMKIISTDMKQPFSFYDEMLLDALHSARRILGMEVAFISKFENGRRVFKYVSSAPEFSPIKAGNSDPLEETYCQRVVDGRMPELLVNARHNPEAQTMPVTESLPIGAHLGVPIKDKRGHVYGTFCCFRRRADDSLGHHSLDTLRCFAEFVGRVLEKLSHGNNEQADTVARILAIIESGNFLTHYQPIINIRQNRPIGYEALTRFQTEPYRPPDKWFAEAAQAGLQAELEIAAIKKALEALDYLPVDTYMSLNVSPETILTRSLDVVFQDYPLHRLVLEVTEHSHVGDYPIIVIALEALRAMGLRLAVDDAGAGYASFQHILKLKPDIIKLDRSLISKIEDDRGTTALAAALVRFAEQTGSIVIAEGVETDAELEILSSLGIENFQGYLLGRPQPIDKAPVF